MGCISCALTVGAVKSVGGIGTGTVPTVGRDGTGGTTTFPFLGTEVVGGDAGEFADKTVDSIAENRPHPSIIIEVSAAAMAKTRAPGAGTEHLIETSEV
jgi:hypothetical protein